MRGGGAEDGREEEEEEQGASRERFALIFPSRGISQRDETDFTFPRHEREEYSCRDYACVARRLRYIYAVRKSSKSRARHKTEYIYIYIYSESAILHVSFADR